MDTSRIIAVGVARLSAVARRTSPLLILTAATTSVALTGCASIAERRGEAFMAASSHIPRELTKVSLPEYRVAPPDILLIEAVSNIRQPTAPLRVGEIVAVQLGNPEPLAPPDPEAGPLEAQYQIQLESQYKFVDGEYLIQPDGALDLGPVYGRVAVAGLTVDEAQAAVVRGLQNYEIGTDGQPTGIANPQVSLTLPNPQAPQPVTGEHLVRPDGSVSLGIYGSVPVAGMSLAEVRGAVEAKLSAYLVNPEVNVDVLAYNSQVIYVITDGGGFGESIARLPVTGNETVLDAVSAIDGLSQVSSKNIWVARPAPAHLAANGPCGEPCGQVMPVDWRAITREGITTTNYQLMPGDRVYIQADHLTATGNFMNKLFGPYERILGVTLLTRGAARSFENNGNRGVGGVGGFGF
ncbi:polysaccharide biosynthesis/export family protein [Alienimonas californiensis]|uniref:Polysaccharide biosynthesis/export protein n=1 Tax=Alienimonas californiensis TaxID=2527989 RepID=A0A517P4C1_9PLAN|nr:polysaccharide biosynthesis/export family protein [Alienimonas californiensis]QDT14196.1 Polysaccharide biosynthesis/export protein [Alienimonas californiensis]